MTRRSAAVRPQWSTPRVVTLKPCAASTSPQPRAPVTRPRCEILDEFAWWLALGLANLTNLFDPEVIVLGGGLVEESDLLLEPIRRLYEGLLYASTHRPRPHLVPAVLGERAGAMGAALIASHALSWER